MVTKSVLVSSSFVNGRGSVPQPRLNLGVTRVFDGVDSLSVIRWSEGTGRRLVMCLADLFCQVSPGHCG